MADERIKRSPDSLSQGHPDGGPEDLPPVPGLRKVGGRFTWMLLVIVACIGATLAVFALVTVAFFVADRGPVAQPLGVEAPRKGDPAPPPALPIDIIQKPAVRLATGRPHAPIDDMVFARETTQLGYFTVDPTIGPGWQFMLYDWKTSTQLTRISFPSRDARPAAALSPKGTRLVAQEIQPRRLSVWSLPDGKSQKKDWHPYAVEPDIGAAGLNLAEVVWAAFLDEERLLTLALSGRFDLWDAKLEKPLYTVRARHQLPLMTGGNFALSGDRQTLAVANDDGLEFFDPSTGRPKGRTEVIAVGGVTRTNNAVAFSGDGTFVASAYTIFHGDKGPQDFLSVWKVGDGARQHHFSLPRDNVLGPAPSGISWMSARHLILWYVGGFEGFVFNLDDGRFHRCLERGFKGSGPFGGHGPGKRIWYGEFGEILAVDFPENELLQNPAAAGNRKDLPRWYFTTAGISRDPPPR